MNSKNLAVLGVSVVMFSTGLVLATRANAAGVIPRPIHQTFTKPEQIQKWQQFCRKLEDFDLRSGPDALNAYLRERGEEGWEVALMQQQPQQQAGGVICFKRPGA